MKAFGLGEIETFPFLNPPVPASIRAGHQLLHELGALDDRTLTPVGRALSTLPVDPRLGRMLVEADRTGCLREVLVIAAALSVQPLTARYAFAAPAASAKATSRGCRTPPSAQTYPPICVAADAHSSTAENCGRPTPVIIRVVHMAPGPTPTLTIVAPAVIRSRVPSADTTLPAASGKPRSSDDTDLMASSILS